MDGFSGTYCGIIYGGRLSWFPAYNEFGYYEQEAINKMFSSDFDLFFNSELDTLRNINNFCLLRGDQKILSGFLQWWSMRKYLES